MTADSETHDSSNTAYIIIISCIATIGGFLYGFYTFCALLSVVFVVKMVHETRGVELEDMQA